MYLSSDTVHSLIMDGFCLQFVSVSWNLLPFVLMAITCTSKNKKLLILEVTIILSEF